jgi:Flp pilus assembly protein TadB
MARQTQAQVSNGIDRTARIAALAAEAKKQERAQKRAAAKAEAERVEAEAVAAREAEAKKQAARDKRAANKVLREQAAAAQTVVGNDPASFEDRFHSLLGDMAASLTLDLPSWKRTVCAFLATAALSVGAGYLIGQIAAYAIVGVMMLGAPMAIAWLIYALALVLSLYAGIKIGQYVGNYVLSGQIDRDVSRAWGGVKSLFTRGNDKLAAA